MNPKPDGPFEDLAARLTTPARSGVCLTRNEIVMLARLEEASLRLGERKRMLVDVLRSARDARELGATIERLAAFCRDSRAQYQRLVEGFPGAVPLLTPWIERVDRTLRSLAELAEDVEAERMPEPP